MLSPQVSNRAEREKNTRWAFLKRGQFAGGAESCKIEKVIITFSI